jgi:hypothetical protein
MKCERCRVEFDEKEITNYKGQNLCEDCCFDLMNPPKTCDPVAVCSTLNIRKELGQKGTEGLSDTQKKIYSLVTEKGSISHEDILKTLNLTIQEFEREFAVLRHCELLRGVKEKGKVHFTKF